MVTKTLTITEDAYNLLSGAKFKDESFSEEILRLFSQKRRRPLSDFFGILSEEEGQGMLDDLKRIKATNLKLLQERLKHEGA